MNAKNRNRVITSRALLLFGCLGICISGAGCGTAPSSQDADSLESCIIGQWEADKELNSSEASPVFDWQVTGYSKLNFSEDKILYDVDYTQHAAGQSGGEEWTYEGTFAGKSEQQYSVEGDELVYGWDKTDGTVEITRVEGENLPTVSTSGWGVPPYGTRAKVTCETDTLTIENLSWANFVGGEGVTVYRRG